MSIVYCVMQGSTPRYVGSTTKSLRVQFGGVVTAPPH